MNKVLRVLVLLPAILFLVTGLRWLVAPAGVAPMFGLTLDILLEKFSSASSDEALLQLLSSTHCLQYLKVVGRG